MIDLPEYTPCPLEKRESIKLLQTTDILDVEPSQSKSDPPINETSDGYMRIKSNVQS